MGILIIFIDSYLHPIGTTNINYFDALLMRHDGGGGPFGFGRPPIPGLALCVAASRGDHGQCETQTINARTLQNYGEWQ